MMPPEPNSVGGASDSAKAPGIIKGDVPSIRDGALTSGTVVSAQGDGYWVRLQGKLLWARSTISLFVGQRFIARWDAKSDPPLLHVKSLTLPAIEQFAPEDRPFAMALLSRGLMANGEAISFLKSAWQQMGFNPALIEALTELLARGLPLKEELALPLAWYLSLSPQAVVSLWGELRTSLKRYMKDGVPLGEALELAGRDKSELRDLMVAHKALLHPLEGGAKLEAPFPLIWPLLGEDEPRWACVNVQVSERRGQKVYHASFAFEGKRIGEVRGDAFSDGSSLVITLRSRDEPSKSLIEEHLEELRHSLSAISLPLRHLSVSVGLSRRGDRTVGRLDVTA